MTSLLDDTRRMVPRWRPSRQSFALGEFTPVPVDRPVEVSPNPNEILADVTKDWVHHRRFGYAADLVSAAAVLALKVIPKPVVDAAEFVVDSTSSKDNRPIRRIAARLLKRIGEESEADNSNLLTDTTAARLRYRRAASRRYPYAPLLWVDMARDHASLGQRAAAEKAMRVAVGLAPEHRFVVRSFTRLALHLGKHDQLEIPVDAWNRLRRLARISEDPWLSAAEIATAMVLGKGPKTVKTARSLLASGNFSPFDLSELAGALGSLEMDAGATRAGKKLLRQALISPTDNAVAQAAWTTRHFDATLLDPRHLELDVTYEARAWENYRARRWQAAIDEATSWHADEPFAARPIQLATFVAAVPMGDFSLSTKLGEMGLAVNPEDQSIRNNVAFSLASQGKWQAATEVLRTIKPSEVEEDMRIEYVATWGLISFRQGDIEGGRSLYQLAIDAAHNQRHREREALATLYLAREECLAKTANAAAAFANAVKRVKAKPLPHLQAVLGQVHSLTDESVRAQVTLERVKEALASKNPHPPIM